MVDLISEYWIILAVVAVIAAAIVLWVLNSRRHVALPPIEIGQATTQTLSRTGSSTSAFASSAGQVQTPDLPPLPFPVNTNPDVEPDDLLQIKGVGPKLARLLIELGVTHYRQIAAFSASDIAALDELLGAFSGRAARDNWVEQARLLDAGDVAGFEAKFGALLGRKP